MHELSFNCPVCESWNIATVYDHFSGLVDVDCGDCNSQLSVDCEIEVCVNGVEIINENKDWNKDEDE